MNIKITFGMIVLNGVPFVKYNLRSLYPFAHQIIVVEGACPAAASVASIDGHSIDGTREALEEFKNEEDPENKLLVVYAEHEGHKNGFWSEKDEMSQAYAKRATGNFLWQVDHDEFYKEEDLDAIRLMLSEQPDITSVHFRTLNFWGGLSYRVDSTWLRCGDQDFRRLFAWGPGYRYLTHRPPTVIDNSGTSQELVKNISAKSMAQKGIFLHHYEYLFPFQVRNKAVYYSNRPVARHPLAWFENCYMNLKSPFKVHNISRWFSWLELYQGHHPHQVLIMMEDIRGKKCGEITTRRTDDIHALVTSTRYIGSVLLLKILSWFVKLVYTDLRLNAKYFLIRFGLWAFVQRLRGRAIDGTLLRSRSLR